MDLTVFARPVTVLLPPDRDPQQRARLHAAWSRCRARVAAATGSDCGSDASDASERPGAVEPVLCDLRTSGAELAAPAGGAQLGDRVTTMVTTRTMESVLGHHLLLHAAGLAAADGRVLALCAPPGTGKTTATRVLARALGYVTDETVAVVPRTGQVLPYPKPLQIIDPSIGSRKVAIGPDELELQELTDPAALRLGPVVVLDRALDADPGVHPKIERLPLAEALPRIVAQTSSLHLLERPLQTLCALMDENGGPWMLRYAEAESLPELLTPWMDGESSRSLGTERWEAAAAATEEALRNDFTNPDPEGGSGRYLRAPVDDAVVVDGGIGVLRGGEFFLLQGIGATAWELMARPRTIDDIAAALVEVHGPVEDAEMITADLLEQLVASGVLEQRGAPDGAEL